MKEEKRSRKIVNEPSIQTDPQGSWTGKPEDEFDIPVQDADDL